MAASKMTQLKVANVCYANVAGQFAMFANEKNRGPNFTWERFIENCVEDSQHWMWIHGITRPKKEVNELAAQYAREIAERLVNHLRS